ncbi:DEAD/DEAH box helicase [Streptomyces sp. LP05-1]|uniref:DEAD/DEAH box helicase n=1 Tax=Streptomyces pyxinae TaxID=2970734 RepID=A0ABT2CBV6_9ACTN|nr:DEAD/DEAH box helicase [Streptomyces sp. LP05-1]MCS0634888.1 DEAD/DEAH box helicase [Streptomyces sp. LP05-1]
MFFLPGDPARTGRVVFLAEDAAGEETAEGAGKAAQAVVFPDGRTPDGPLVELSVAGPDGRLREVRGRALPPGEALPLLTRLRLLPDVSPAAAFWGAAALLALALVARGRLLPGASPDGHDAWRTGPPAPGDLERVRALAGAMPPEARAVPVGAAPDGTPLLPAAGPLLRAFLDAVADDLARPPAAPLLAGGSVFAAVGPRLLSPEQREWAAEVAAGHDAGVRLSLRVEVTGLDQATEAAEAEAAGAAETGTAEAAETEGAAEVSADGTVRPRFRAVLQLHGVADPALVADAAGVWSGTVDERFGPRARTDALLALRRAARVWEPLAPLLSAAVPDAVDLVEEEVAELLGPAGQALAAHGVTVHWPRGLARPLTARVVVGPAEDGPGNRSAGAPGRPAGSGGSGGSLSPGGLLAFDWRFAVGGEELTRAELERLAEAGRPLVRLHDRWVLVDPGAVRRARERRDRRMAPVEALGAVLTGTTEAGGEQVPVEATGRLRALRDRLADPEAGPRAIGAPDGLDATLRDCQLRGLDWLHRMTSLGLGACLADDMGLGKTITLIALHLHRNGSPGTAGPTLVVCPASLLGNWQREVERFAPGTPVRRFHGPAREPAELPAGAVVLTTYGTMRRDAARLAGTDWGLVVADEAQHIKNPYAATARALRTIGARARVALTGTPVENNLSELWAILDWTTPGLLGRLGTFRDRYARAVEGGDPVAAGRLAALVRPFLLRRRKSDPGIAPELPPKTETDRVVSLTAEQAGLYEAVVRETLAAVAAADGMERRGLVLRLLTSLKQICNHPAQYLKEHEPRIAGRSGKLALLDELLDTVLAEDAGVLVFTQYVAMARLLERHLAGRGVRTRLLHGSTPVAEREAMVAGFQAGEVPVFLLSLKAAGTGLNLTRASHVVHYDRWWNPAVEAQATDRAYRIGQTRPVQVHRLIAEGTVEDRIAGLLERKKELADAVLAAGEPALTELSDADLARLVELRPAVGPGGHDTEGGRR